jgi:hypothetical protein
VARLTADLIFLSLALRRTSHNTVSHLLPLNPLLALPSVHVLLTDCSSDGLAVICHCHDHRAFFPAGWGTIVKCLADAGLYLDAYIIALLMGLTQQPLG